MDRLHVSNWALACTSPGPLGQFTYEGVNLYARGDHNMSSVSSPPGATLRQRTHMLGPRPVMCEAFSKTY